MGSSSSKPSDSGPHVWKGAAQTGVSQNLVEHLETSNETDTSRLQSLELQIQNRVAAELKRLRAQESDALLEAQQKLSAEPADAADQHGGKDRQDVAKAIGELRAKLEERKGFRQVPEGLERARGQVVRCLRENDRRPLDCWREVEAFKEEVRRMEKGWVDQVVS
ncbi:DUF1690-domain-containing protein [Trichocladium antarcticum]|uniref:DUF1690-domain-containing protein n=1 Tax=Trichocladium antarcticum TaxID=1450529 RepID=A0AAN6UI74_9PEZI|nr:DUF1690-domain-containing protein [Trichocladium antarcticum]